MNNRRTRGRQIIRQVLIFTAVLSTVCLTRQPEPMAGAAMTVTPTDYDFGTVPEGPPARLTVALTNTGNVDVRITGIRTN